MKAFLASVAFMLCGVGCFYVNKIDFVYFDLGPNEIFVDSVAGLPPWAAPGVLVPSLAEDQFSEKSATTYNGPVAVPATLTIVWHEGGASHRLELKRDDLGIPAKIKKGKIHFSYLGADKWRVRFLDK